jgi:uncharacterized damage-inducible protein DinB
MATSPAAIAAAPNTMPATAARGLVASPRLTRLRAISPVNSAAIPRGTPSSSQHVASASTPKISEVVPIWFRGASGWLMDANSRHCDGCPGGPCVVLGSDNVGMVDQKPPRSSGDEREVLMTLLQYQRESLVRKAAGVDDGAARRSPVASGTSLLWLVRHLADAERLWIMHRFAGGEKPPPEAGSSHDTLDAALTAYRRTWSDVDAVIAATPTLDEVSVIADNGGHPTLRWILAHLLEETARHAGHADILRELIDGVTGR